MAAAQPNTNTSCTSARPLVATVLVDGWSQSTANAPPMTVSAVGTAYGVRNRYDHDDAQWSEAPIAHSRARSTRPVLPGPLGRSNGSDQHASEMDTTTTRHRLRRRSGSLPVLDAPAGTGSASTGAARSVVTGVPSAWRWPGGGARVGPDEGWP